MTKQINTKKNLRGFAAMDNQKQQEIARKGGNAWHKRRGFQAMDPEKQREIARKGGSAPHKRRGFQIMNPEKQREIARMGGKASHRGRVAKLIHEIGLNDRVQQVIKLVKSINLHKSSKTKKRQLK